MSSLPFRRPTVALADDTVPDGSREAEEVHKDDEAFRRPWRATLICRRRRAQLPPAFLALAAAFGVLIWLICVLAVDDPLLVSERAATGEVFRFRSGFEVALQGGQGASSKQDFGAAATAVPRPSSTTPTVSGEFRMSKRTARAERAAGAAWSAGHAAAKALFERWNFTNSTARQHLVAALGQNASLNFFRKREELMEDASVQFHRKRQELLERGAQVQTGSRALADAIASGQVHRRVIFIAIAGFLACVVALQVLGAARGELRQLVRRVLAKSLIAQPAHNELVTRPYTTWPELFLRVSVDFLNEPANVMLLSIGSLQVLATWSKADPLRCKKVNLLVLLLCFAYTLVQEVRAQLLAARHDAEWNLASSKRCLPNGVEEVIFAKDVQVGDIIILGYGDVCPATGRITRSSHSFVLFNSICETGEDCCSTLVVGSTVMLGFVLAMEAAEVQVEVTATRNGAFVDAPRDACGRALSSTSKYRRMERFPEHMNRPLTRANLAALALLFGTSVLVCALSYEHGGAAERTGSSSWGHVFGGISSAEARLMTHFFSAAIQLNTLIPSMRWVVLFFFYVFLIEAARPEVSVQNWRAFHGLEARRVLYSDKTGTLTEVGLSVAHLRFVDSGEDVTHGGSRACAGMENMSVPWLAAVLMACNDAQALPSKPCTGPIAGRRAGTSPEEIAIAEHLQKVLGICIRSNPLKPGALSLAPLALPAEYVAEGKTVDMHLQPLVLYDPRSHDDVFRGLVVARSDFDPSKGFREASVTVLRTPGEDGAAKSWLVRQGGADIIADLAGRGAREAELAAKDRDRALGWCVACMGADGSRVGAWRYLLRASFSNPPRATSAPLVAHCRATGVAVRMLTGDAFVAAVHIAREIGILAACASGCVAEGPPTCCVYEPDEAPQKFTARLRATLLVEADLVCVVMPGAVLRQLIEAGDRSDEWLGEDRVSAVIYRTRAADKALIVRRTEEYGRLRRRRLQAASLGTSCGTCAPERRQGEEGVCMMMGDASNDAEAISLDGVVGVSLKHGAAPCKLGADFVVSEPGALVAVRQELRARALVGAKWLLEDVCFLCGLVSSLTLCGVWAAGFNFLPRGFLYDDPFDARLMTLFSSGLYAPSVCTAACVVGATAASGPKDGKAPGVAVLPVTDRPRVVRSLLLGTFLGSCLGLAGPTDSAPRLGPWILSSTVLVSLLRHMIVCVQCSCPGAGIKRRCDEPDTPDGGATAMALGPPNILARVLLRSREVWTRTVALCIFLVLVRI